MIGKMQESPDIQVETQKRKMTIIAYFGVFFIGPYKIIHKSSLRSSVHMLYSDDNKEWC